MKSNQVSRGTKIVRSLPVATVKDAGSQALDFTITTGTRDRERDIVSPDGIVSAGFQTNPVMLWAHQYDQPPIGKSVQLWQQGQSIKARVQFVPDDVYPASYSGIRGSMVYQMYRLGYLNAVSVGFNAIEWEPIVEKDEDLGGLAYPNGGTLFKQWELLEFSGVPVPANPQALIDRGLRKKVKEFVEACANCNTGGSMLSKLNPNEIVEVEVDTLLEVINDTNDDDDDEIVEVSETDLLEILNS